MQMLKNHITDQSEDLKTEFGKYHFLTYQAKNDVDFLLSNNTSEIMSVK